MSDNMPNVGVVDPCLACGQTVRPRQEAIQLRKLFILAARHMQYWYHALDLSENVKGRRGNTMGVRNLFEPCFAF